MLQKLFEKFQETYKPFDASLGTFYPPDLKELEKILEINELGQEHGQNNRPAANAKKKDSVSQSIDHAMNLIISEGRQELLNYVSGATGLTSGQSSSRVQQSENIMKQTLSRLQEAAKAGVIELFPLKSDIMRGERNLNKFRKENGLSRPSMAPSSISSGWGLIAIAALFETVLNAITLQDAHKDGLIGVGLEVFLFTAANIGMACILGSFLLRLANHITSTKKVMGFAGGAVFVCLIGGLNLSFAHYRDALMRSSKGGVSDAQFLEQATQVMTAAIQNMMVSPFMLSDGKSYLLFFIGGLLAFFAAYKSYRLDDPYPGYGRLDRMQKDSHDDYLQTVEDFFEDLGGIAEEGIKELEGISHTSEGAKNQIHQREIILQKLEEKFRAWLMIVDTWQGALLSIPRGE